MIQTAAIQLHQVTKRFRMTRQVSGSLKGILMNLRHRRRAGWFTALDCVDLTVQRGETVAVIGANGSGKSTLLGLVARVLRPTEGEVSVHGRVAPLLQLGVGFHPDLTGRENIVFNGIILGLTRQEVQRRVDAIIAFAEMEEFIDAPVHTYSSGMVLRLGFAVAAHTDPDVILMDEVLAVGDQRFQRKCLDRVRRFQADGCSILLVTHEMAHVREVATRCIWVEHGRVVQDGAPDTVVNAYLESSE